jgi:nitroreductase
MEVSMSPTLEAIFQRRAVKVFEPVEIPQAQRELILEAARVAPSSFNMQPYRFYWVESPSMRKRAAQLCMGQSPAKTASALVVAVADIGSWRSTTQSYLEWVRQSGFSRERISQCERKAKFGQMVFHSGMVRGSRHLEVDRPSHGEPLDDHWDAARIAAGAVQVGDEEYVPGL